MGGRGKSSGVAAARPSFKGPPLNFADPSAITLEQLEGAGPRRVETKGASAADVAQGLDQVVREMLEASPRTFRAHEGTLRQTLAQIGRQLRERPEAERRAFAAELEPVLRRLRDKAGGRS